MGGVRSAKKQAERAGEKDVSPVGPRRLESAWFTTAGPKGTRSTNDLPDFWFDMERRKNIFCFC